METYGDNNVLYSAGNMCAVKRYVCVHWYKKCLLCLKLQDQDNKKRSGRMVQEWILEQGGFVEVQKIGLFDSLVLNVIVAIYFIMSNVLVQK